MGVKRVFVLLAFGAVTALLMLVGSHLYLLGPRVDGVLVERTHVTAALIVWAVGGAVGLVGLVLLVAWGAFRPDP